MKELPIYQDEGLIKMMDFTYDTFLIFKWGLNIKIFSKYRIYPFERQWNNSRADIIQDYRVFHFNLQYSIKSLLKILILLYNVTNFKNVISIFLYSPIIYYSLKTNENKINYILYIFSVLVLMLTGKNKYR